MPLRSTTGASSLIEGPSGSVTLTVGIDLHLRALLQRGDRVAVAHARGERVVAGPQAAATAGHRRVDLEEGGAVDDALGGEQRADLRHVGARRDVHADDARAGAVARLEGLDAEHDHGDQHEEGGDRDQAAAPAALAPLAGAPVARRRGAADGPARRGRAAHGRAPRREGAIGHGSQGTNVVCGLLQLGFRSRFRSGFRNGFGRGLCGQGLARPRRAPRRSFLGGSATVFRGALRGSVGVPADRAQLVCRSSASSSRCTGSPSSPGTAVSVPTTGTIRPWPCM